MFNSTFSASTGYNNNITRFFRPSEVMDAIYEQWSVNERLELNLNSMFDNMEWEHNPFQESDIDSILDAYWGWEEINPFNEEDVEEIPDLPKWNFL